MTTLADMVADLQERLDDATDTKVSAVAKKRYINFGIAATWDRLYKVIVDDSSSYAREVTEYPLPTSFAEDARIFRVELESPEGSGNFFPISDFDVLPAGSEVGPGSRFPTLVLPLRRWADGVAIRVMAAARLASLSLDADVYDGPVGTDELPVLYAMGCSLSKRVEERVDHRRYNLTIGANGNTVDDTMVAADRWYAQFEIMLDRFAMPMPMSPI